MEEVSTQESWGDTDIQSIAERHSKQESRWCLWLLRVSEAEIRCQMPGTGSDRPVGGDGGLADATLIHSH